MIISRAKTSYAQKEKKKKKKKYFFNDSVLVILIPNDPQPTPTSIFGESQMVLVTVLQPHLWFIFHAQANH